MKNEIQQVLRERNITQAELAARVGVKREYINKIIKNHITPTVSLALKIAQALHLRVEDVFYVSHEERPQELLLSSCRQDLLIDFMLQKKMKFAELHATVVMYEKSFVERLLARLSRYESSIDSPQKP